MPSEIRSRLVVLAGLTVLGVALAGVGTALGMTAPLTNHGDNPTFAVNEENVTFTDNGNRVTLVENMSTVRSVRIDKVGSTQFQVSTETAQPLTAAERERARRIALNNQTVQSHLASLENYEVTIEPIRRLNMTSMQVASFNATKVNDSGDGGSVFKITNVSSEHEDGTVVVQRDPQYVEDRAVVRIRQPGAPERQALKYTVRVDLANDTVTGITDWEEIR